MPRSAIPLAGFFALAIASIASGQPTSLQIEATGGAEVFLRGKDARQQLLVTGKNSEGALRDYTHQARYWVTPPGIVKVDEHVIVMPMANGAVTVTAESEGVTATIAVKVE